MKHQLLATLAAHGQEHLLAFWNQLDEPQRESLAGQIRQIDFDLLERLYRHRGEVRNVRDLLDRAGPPPAVRLVGRISNPPSKPDGLEIRPTPEEARRRGRAALEAGEVGVVLVAGGQGTRLGFDHPKGMFPIGPVSGRSLFQVYVEKIVAAARRCGAGDCPDFRAAKLGLSPSGIPLCLMTSPATHDETVAYFAQNNRFGLADGDLTIFCQGTMPAVDAESGRVLLESPGRIAVSPDGHGGMLAALAGSGVLDALRRRGIRHLFYLQVDNPLVDIGAAEFLGYHLLGGSELTTQVVAKRDPLERLGNVVEVDGRLVVIEYSDLPEDLARRRNADGSLAIWAGSIAVHAMDAAFLGRMAGRADALPFHVARKRVSYVDAAGEQVEPAGPNAIKFERFIFDLMPAAANAMVVEVDPAEGFAPLKNASGAAADTPEAVRAAMMAQHRRWLRRAGAEVPDDVDVEISPLWALDADEVAEKLQPGTRVTKDTFFC